MDFSIIIPTWNRSELVDDLLSSLFDERNRYSSGMTEVLVVDSSIDDERNKILMSCSKYNAIYIYGDDSVRKKRNKGIISSKYEYILFLDSDVVVKSGILDEYVCAYEKLHDANLGGILGYTEFIGSKSFWWKILEKTSLIDSFSFAKRYPFHSWTIGNNVSFKKNVLIEVGMFEENLPFKLGGDDLDLTYRITKKGYLIGSAPNAITYHSRSTWNSYKAIHDRAKRWGTMEFFIAKRHPELYQRIIPKTYIVELFAIIVSSIVSLLLNNPMPIIGVIIWVLLNMLIKYSNNCHKNGISNPIYFVGSQIIQLCYEYYRIKQSIIGNSVSVFTHGLVFNRFQIQYGIADDALRINTIFLSYLITNLTMLLFSLIIRGYYN